MAETQVLDVLALFRQAALEVNNKKIDALSRSTVIAQLGMDSVAVMELIAFFEEKLQIRLPDEDLAEVRTLGDLCNLVQKLLPNVKVAA